MEQTRENIISRMDAAAKEDRERFFSVADTLQFQPKYQDKQQEIEEIKQTWRDMTDIPDYPQIKWPLVLPEWFPKVYFASLWDVDYLEKTLEQQEQFRINMSPVEQVEQVEPESEVK